MYNRKRGRPKDPPSVAITNAKELLEKNKPENAFNVLFETISYRHRAQFDQTYEEAMKLYINVGVSILKSCKEGFLHYRSLVQQNHPQSLERMINHLVDSVESIGEKEIAQLGDNIDCEQQYDSKVLKYEWDSFQVALMILRNNGKLNHVYKRIVKKCIQFCLKLNRSTEFKKLCDVIRKRFGYVINNQSFDYALKINSSETLNSMFEIRLNLLQCALSMKLHQESFKTIKDIQKNVIDRSFELKKNIDPLLYATFYEKLSIVFWGCNRYLLHSYALFESYKKLKVYIHTKIGKKQKELKTKELKKLYIILQESLISILIVPSSNTDNISVNNDDLISNNKDYTHSLYQLANVFFGFGRKQILPSKVGLLNTIIKEINSYNLYTSSSASSSASEEQQQQEDNDENDGMITDDFQNAKDLYKLIVINRFSPLTFSNQLNTIIHKLNVENHLNIKFYMDKIFEIGIIVLLRQLSSCYKSISWQRFKQLAQFKFMQSELNDIDLERIITYSVYYGNICCRISHSNQLITFFDDNLESKSFANSIVELNHLLIGIKKEQESTNKNNMINMMDDQFVDDQQRTNVFNQIRNQINSDHDKIQNRLNKIRWKQVNQIKQKKAQQIKKHKEIEREKKLQKEEEEKKKEAVTQSKKTQTHIQEKKAEKIKIKNETKLKWNQILNKNSENKMNSIKNQMTASNLLINTKTNIQQKNKTSRLIQIENAENELKQHIEREIKRKDGNIQDARNKMADLERLQIRKQKKILQIEKMEFDHFCRASRKYLIQRIKSEIDTKNEADVGLQKVIWKKQNKENKEKHQKRIQIRNRLNQIREKHFNSFQQIIHRQNEENKEKQKQKQQQRQKQLQQQQQQQQKKSKQKQKQKTKSKSKSISPSPTITPSAEKQLKSQKSQKQKPKSQKTQKQQPKQKESEQSQSQQPQRYRPQRISSEQIPTRPQKPETTKKRTFADKIRAQRNQQQQSNDNGQSNGAFGDRFNRGSSSFGSRFSNRYGRNDQYNNNNQYNQQYNNQYNQRNQRSQYNQNNTFMRGRMANNYNNNNKNDDDNNGSSNIRPQGSSK